jgi:hypothetical protein
MHNARALLVPAERVYPVGDQAVAAQLGLGLHSRPRRDDGQRPE